MLLEQTRWSGADGWTPAPTGTLSQSAQLVLAFGSRAVLQRPGVIEDIRRAYPSAHLTGCSTAGEIFDTHVFDDTVVVTAIAFRGTPPVFASVSLTEGGSSEAAGAELAAKLTS